MAGTGAMVWPPRATPGILVSIGGFTNRTPCDIVKRTGPCEIVHERHLTALGLRSSLTSPSTDRPQRLHRREDTPTHGRCQDAT